MIIAVTNDEYELPVFIEDSYKAMAEKAGASRTTVSRHCRGLVTNCIGKYKYVEIKERDMSLLWAYDERKCDGDFCPGDCDSCSKAEAWDGEEDGYVTWDICLKPREKEE